MGRWLAGLRQWSGPSVSDAPAAAIEKLREIPVPQGAAGMSLPRLMELILIGLSQPVFLNDLADYIGAALGGVGRLEDPGEADARRSSGPSAAPSTGIVNQLEQRDWLSQLWTEIAQLPRNQKAALLLNLRDHNGDSALHLFPSMGIATIRQIAAALEMPAPELAEAWRELPVGSRNCGEALPHQTADRESEKIGTGTSDTPDGTGSMKAATVIFGGFASSTKVAA